LITHHSEYFRNALKESWKEAEENTITIKDIEPAIFDIFVQWLYTQTLPTYSEISLLLKKHPTDEHDDDRSVTILTKAAVFGDRFLVPRFCEVANNAIVNFILTKNGPRPLNFLYASKYAIENLPEDDILIEFFVDIHCQYMDHKDNDLDPLTTGWFKQNMPREFLVRLISRYCWVWRQIPTQHPDYSNRCDYHKHASGKKRKECSQKQTEETEERAQSLRED
jgi:hypothetical protein